MLRQSKFEKELDLQNSFQRIQCAAHSTEHTNQILLSIKTASNMQNELPRAVQLCYGDQKEFGHLFFRLVFFYIIFTYNLIQVKYMFSTLL